MGAYHTEPSLKSRIFDRTSITSSSMVHCFYTLLVAAIDIDGYGGRTSSRLLCLSRGFARTKVNSYRFEVVP